MTKEKAVIVIGGGKIGINQIKIIQKLGFKAIVTDINPHAPGLKLADLKIICSAIDYETLMNKVNIVKDSYEVIDVYCGNDFGLLGVEFIRQLLGLPNNSIKSMLACKNKILMKKLWEENAIQSPKGLIFSKSMLSENLDKKLRFPIIIKPIDSSGSRGISIVKNINDNNEILRSSIDEAFKNSDLDEILIEEYIEGRHHDVNGFFINSTFYICGIMDRYFTDFPYKVPIYGYYPSSLTNDVKEKIYKITENAARAIGIKHGPVKGDVLVTKDGEVFIYEVSARFHGDVSSSHLYHQLNRKSPLEVYIESLNDLTNYSYNEEDIEKLAGWSVIQLDKGIIKNIEIDDNNHPETVLGYDLRVKNGGEIKSLIDNTKVPGFVWIVGTTEEEIRDDYIKFIRSINIEYE